MRIGELAQTSGTPIETIRFYEREGLLPAAARTEGNYRIYTPQHADRLGFIRQCRSLDMTLDEVRVLLRFKDQPTGRLRRGEQPARRAHRPCGRADQGPARPGEGAEGAAGGLPSAACSSADCGILQGIDHAGAKPPTASKRHVRGAH
jgi:DNA-binding transcriptional MerR regulator